MPLGQLFNCMHGLVLDAVCNDGVGVVGAADWLLDSHGQTGHPTGTCAAFPLDVEDPIYNHNFHSFCGNLCSRQSPIQATSRGCYCGCCICFTASTTKLTKTWAWKALAAYLVRFPPDSISICNPGDPLFLISASSHCKTAVFTEFQREDGLDTTWSAPSPP